MPPRYSDFEQIVLPDNYYGNGFPVMLLLWLVSVIGKTTMSTECSGGIKLLIDFTVYTYTVMLVSLLCCSEFIIFLWNLVGIITLIITFPALGDIANCQGKQWIAICFFAFLSLLYVFFTVVYIRNRTKPKITKTRLIDESEIDRRARSLALRYGLSIELPEIDRPKELHQNRQP